MRRQRYQTSQQKVVMLFGLSLLVCLTLVASATGAIPEQNLYPFGLQNEDEEIPPNDDASSGVIELTTFFPFFGTDHNKTWINTNGVLSFDEEITIYRPREFPLTSEFEMVAPYWADVDTTFGYGRVYYRQTTEAQVLERASADVVRAFPKFPDFKATWAMVATWHNVTCYHCPHPLPENTFQAVLTTDGELSFAFFLYTKINWIYGKASNNISAQVGFDKGDGKAFYSVPGALTPDIKKIVEYSNCGESGKFAFQINMEHIVVVNQTDPPPTEPWTTERPLTTTTKKASPTTAAPHCRPCNGRGTYTCKCQRGYTGERCEKEIDWCDEPVEGVHGNATMRDLCRPHGNCSSSPVGAVCTCDWGWTGQFCDHEIHEDIWVGHRCAVYDTPVIRTKDVKVGCKPTKEGQEQHCVPDDLDCFYVHCQNPIGWCLPIGRQNLQKLMAIAKKDLADKNAL